MIIKTIKLTDNYGNEYNPIIVSSKYSDDLCIALKQIGSSCQTPSWNYKTFMNHSSDKLYIDAGQNWYVDGMKHTSAIFRNIFK